MAIGDTHEKLRAIQQYSAPYAGNFPEPDGTPFDEDAEFGAFAGIYPVFGVAAAGGVGGSFFIHRPGDAVGKFTSQILPEPF
jgi:hypothetical protein